MPEIDTSDLNVSLATLGVFLCVYGLISYLVKDKLYFSEPLIAMVIGVAIGPHALNWIDPLAWDESPGWGDYITLSVTRVVIGIQVLFAGIDLPKKYLKLEFQSLMVLLLPVMTIAWLISAGLVRALIPGLTFLECLCIAACVTPTDPILANSITKGRFAEKHVPGHVRNILVGESGANDGLGYPFLFLPLLLIVSRSPHAEVRGTYPVHDLGSTIAVWIYDIWIYQILLSIVVGFLIGHVARKTLRYAQEKEFIDHESFIAYGFGLAALVMGTMGMIGSDDLLACFVAGNSFSWDDYTRIAAEEARFQNILDGLLNAATFIYIGAIIPWSAYENNMYSVAGWRYVVLAILILLLRRPPVVIGLYWFVPALRNLREATFAGYFGPIGVSAVFYAQVALKNLPEEREHVRNLVVPVVYFMVFGSIMAHGMSLPLGMLYARTVTLTRTMTAASLLPTRAGVGASAGTSGASLPLNKADIKRVDEFPAARLEPMGGVSTSALETLPAPAGMPTSITPLPSIRFTHGFDDSTPATSTPRHRLHPSRRHSHAAHHSTSEDDTDTVAPLGTRPASVSSAASERASEHSSSPEQDQQELDSVAPLGTRPASVHSASGEEQSRSPQEHVSV